MPFSDLIEPLLTKPVVVALAVLGALVSASASVLQARGKVDEARGRLLNRVGYILMGTSMLLFALAGLRGLSG